MTRHTFELLNVQQKIGKPAWELGSEHGPRLEGADDWHVELRRMRGGLSDGIDVVTLNNGALEIDVLPTRGMGIWKGDCNGLRLGWDSPVALPVHPAWVNLESRDRLGWLDGFNEWLCRCGLAFNGPPETDNGTPITLHGKIANRAAHELLLEIDDEAGTISLQGVIDETSMFGTNLRLTSRITLTAGKPVVSIDDRVTNRGSGPQEYELLYHINQGTPFLVNESLIETPFEEMSPRDERAAEGVDAWSVYRSPERGYSEQVYFFRPLSDDRGFGHALLRNDRDQTGLHVSFQTSTLPYLAVWKNTQASEDGYVTGLEPCTDLPNHRSYERKQGRLKTIPPGDTVIHELEISVARDADELQAKAGLIRKLQESKPPTVHPTPAF